MNLPTERYVVQSPTWPADGRHILAHFDDETIIVYQAYRPSIAAYAVRHGHLGGDEFSYGRMSWIKPNFLWMMYRSGWGTKPDQQATLALRIRRSFFDALLERAVSSTFFPDVHASRDSWESSVRASDVRLQWDPDHHPTGAKLDRRALQLGLRGDALEALGKRELLEVIDLTDFVTGQRPFVSAGARDQLMMPTERLYRPASDAAARNVGLSRPKVP